MKPFIKIDLVFVIALSSKTKVCIDSALFRKFVKYKFLTACMHHAAVLHLSELNLTFIRLYYIKVLSYFTAM